MLNCLLPVQITYARCMVAIPYSLSILTFIAHLIEPILTRDQKSPAPCFDFGHSAVFQVTLLMH